MHILFYVIEEHYIILLYLLWTTFQFSVPSLEVGAEEAEHTGEGSPGGVVHVLPPVVPPDGPAVLHVPVLPVDALLPEIHHPQY